MVNYQEYLERGGHNICEGGLFMAKKLLMGTAVVGTILLLFGTLILAFPNLLNYFIAFITYPEVVTAFK